MPADKLIQTASETGPLSFSKDSLAAWCRDGKVHFYSLESGAETRTVEIPANARRSFTFGPRSLYAASANAEHVIAIRDLKNGEILHQFRGHTGAVGRMAISEDNRQLASTSAAELAIRVWDIPTSNQRHKLPDGIGGASAVAFSPDGKTLVVANNDTDLRVFDTQSGKLVKLITEQLLTMFDLSFSPDGKLLAAAGADGVISLFDATSWRKLRELKGQPHLIGALRFSPDGKLLATGGFDADTVRNPVKVILFNSATGAPLRTLDAPHTVRSIEFSADSAWFAASYGEKRISLWSATA